MTTVELDFKEALRIDMERRGLSEASLGKALGISQQAVHKWIERGFPPLSRLDALLDILGRDSEVARLGKDRLYTSTSRTYMKPPSVQDATPAYPPVRYMHNTAAEMRHVHQTIEMSFLDALPPVLRANVEKVVTLGDRPFRMDYMGEKLVVEMVVVATDAASRNTASAMLTLVTVAAAHPGVKPLYMVVQPDDGPQRPLSRQVSAAAEQFGVEVVYVRNGEDAAREIALREGVDLTTQHLVEPDE